MDANKLMKLQDIGYTIHRCCGLCQHGVFAGKADFGTCALLTYDHLKHTEANRQLSINRYGVCQIPQRWRLSEPDKAG